MLLKPCVIRHRFFEEKGCRLSDHGIEEFYAEDYTQKEIDAVFNKVFAGNSLTPVEVRKFKTAMMVEFAIMDWETDGPSNSITEPYEIIILVCFAGWVPIPGTIL
jgi:glucuronate isomerase